MTTRITVTITERQYRRLLQEVAEELDDAVGRVEEDAEETAALDEPEAEEIAQKKRKRATRLRDQAKHIRRHLTNLVNSDEITAETPVVVRLGKLLRLQLLGEERRIPIEEIIQPVPQPEEMMGDE